MFDFSSSLDLALIWVILIGTGILIYVLLDGFDLGIGILFPFAPSNICRDRMMNSIAPFWDGNETWLVLGGGGLFAAFPLAYSVLLPAFYAPITLMLLGLILRGISFEFRFKAERSRRVWDFCFYLGSLVAALAQGFILGAFIQGVEIDGRHFAGNSFDWFTPFSCLTAIALVFGYILLGSTWLIMKTEDKTQEWARKVAKNSLIVVGIFILLVTLVMPLIDSDIKDFWFHTKAFYYMMPLPILTLIFFLRIWFDLKQKSFETRPFFLSLGIFLLCYIGLGLSFYPWMVPFHYTFWQAAASGPSLSLLLVGITPLLPLILAYTGYSYYIFRGKTGHEHMY